jgi:hypothetical protein
MDAEEPHRPPLRGCVDDSDDSDDSDEDPDGTGSTWASRLCSWRGPG